MSEPGPVYFTLGGRAVELCQEPPTLLGVGWAWLGPQVTLWRRYRDGTESEERLPRLLAEWTLAAIPEIEPDVARAKLG